MDLKSTLRNASALAEVGRLDDAWRLTDGILSEEPNNVPALTLATQIMRKLRRNTMSYHLAKGAVREAPQLSAAWLNLGCASADLYQREEAEWAYDKAAELMPAAATPKQRAMLPMNRSAMCLDYGEWALAERYARESLALDPSSAKCMGNLGIALLAQGQWDEGWRYYSAIGHEHRHRFQYGDARPWDGKREHRVVFNGEQGLGDEICFASMLPDAFNFVVRPIVDCDRRLKGLFRRSFPQAKVYGTRWEKDLDWDPQDQDIQASTSFGELGQWFRRTDADFPGTPYLEADPDRVAMWQSRWHGPTIGVAWTGGMSWTGARFRRMTLEQLLPVFRSVPDARWISLQYKDAQGEIDAFHVEHPEIDLVQYRYGTLTDDYDDTAALVASLGAVVSMQTAVVHLGGALGKPVECFVHAGGQWRYGATGTSMPWYRSVYVHRQAGQEWPVDAVAARLRQRFCALEVAA